MRVGAVHQVVQLENHHRVGALLARRRHGVVVGVQLSGETEAVADRQPDPGAGLQQGVLGEEPAIERFEGDDGAAQAVAVGQAHGLWANVGELASQPVTASFQSVNFKLFPFPAMPMADKARCGGRLAGADKGETGRRHAGRTMRRLTRTIQRARMDHRRSALLCLHKTI